MTNLVRLLLIAGCFLRAGCVSAGTDIDSAWVRGTVAAQTVTPVFLVLESSAAGYLADAASPVAEHVELHEMRAVDIGPKVSHRVKTIPIEAGVKLRMTPIGYHLMLVGLKQPIVAGQKIPITLGFMRQGRFREEIRFTAEARDFFTPERQK